ncbi:DUF6507 family protein [Streptomyces bohaiensis]|nr:DUF6507 family protein [Streptomyces bohaiensis]
MRLPGASPRCQPNRTTRQSGWNQLSGGLTYGSSSAGAVGSAVQRFAARVNSCMHSLDGDSSASSEGAGTVTAVYVTGDAAMEATATTALHRGAGEPPHWPGLNRI